MFESTHFVYDETYFIDDSLLSIFHTIQIILSIFTTIFYLILLYAVLLYSPKQIGTYKYHIIIHASLGTILDLVITFGKPDILLPYPIVVIQGFPNLFIYFGEEYSQMVAYFCLNLVIYCIAGLVYLTAGMFVYRYLQSSQSLYFDRMANMRNYLLSFLSYMIIVVTFIVIIPGNMSLLPSEAIKEEFRINSQIFYSRMRDYIVLGIDIKSNQTSLLIIYISAVSIIIFGIFFTAYCVWLTHNHLKQNSHLLKHKTLNLFQSLLNILIIDLFVFGGILSIVVSIPSLAYISNAKFASTITYLAMIIGQCYPPFTYLLLLLYIKPYRESIFRHFGLKRFIKRPSRFSAWTENAS